MTGKNQQKQLNTVLVTGACGALGQVVLDRFLEAGCQVVGTRISHKGQEPEWSLDAERKGLSWLSVDLADAQSVRSAFRKLDEKQIALQGVAHCAGGFRFTAVEELTDEDLEFLLNANLKSSFLLVRELLPRFKEQKFGRLVFVGAKATEKAGFGMAPYAASKAGLNMLVQSVAEEVKDENIKLNALLPSIIDTPANREAMAASDFSTWVPREHLAEMIFALTQPWMDSLNGALIPVTGRV